MHEARRTHLNLMPARYRRWALVRAAVTAWAGVWLLGLAVTFCIWWQLTSGWGDVHKEASQLERRYAPTLALKREIQAMRQRLAGVRTEEEAAAGLESDHPGITLLGLISRASKACNQRLHVRECVLERTTSAREAATGASQILTVKGAALDLLCVTRFHALLRDAALFQRVELRPTTSERIGDLDAYAFHVECLY